MAQMNETRLKQRSIGIKLLALGFFAVLFLLIAQVLANPTDINDSWILAGLFPYFLLLTLLYSAIAGFSSSLKLITAISAIYLVAVNMIPNLKYVFVYGYHDPLYHYGSIQETMTSGYAAGVGIYKLQYGAIPGLHIFVSELSMVTGLDTLMAYKLFLTICPLILPLVVYLVVKKICMPAGLAKTTIASTVITAPITYVYTGTATAYFLYVIFIYLFLLFLTRSLNSRREFLIAFLLGMTIVMSHDVTSFFLMVTMLAVLLLMVLGKNLKAFQIFAHVPVYFTLTFITIASAHFVLSLSILNFSNILSLIREVFQNLSSGQLPVATSFYSGFYGLTLFDKAKILLVRFAKDAVSIFLIVLSPLAISRLRLANAKLRGFYKVLLVPMLLALSVFIVFFFLRPIETRGLIYATAFFPFLAGATIFHLFCSKNHRFKHTILTVSLFFIICLCTLSTYPFQPLLPKYSTTQATYYAYDLRTVNSVYDRSLILFSWSHGSKGNMWADGVLEGQIYALTNSSFQSLLVSSRAKARLLLVSDSGPTHVIPSGREAFASGEYVHDALSNCSILYSNGFSYLLLNMSASIAP